MRGSCRSLRLDGAFWCGFIGSVKELGSVKEPACCDLEMIFVVCAWAGWSLYVLQGSPTMKFADFHERIPDLDLAMLGARLTLITAAVLFIFQGSEYNEAQRLLWQAFPEFQNYKLEIIVAKLVLYCEYVRSTLLTADSLK